MRAMQATLPVPPTTSPRPWQTALLWAGLPLCLFGMFWHDVWQQWHPGRFGELLLLSLLAWGLAWPLRHFARWQWASAMALVWFAALAWFAGLLPTAATALLALAALALGGLVASRQPVALQIACGLVMLGAALAWLLPLPVHTRWTYFALCAALLAIRRHALMQSFHQAKDGWQAAVSPAPRAAAFAILAMGLASTGAWLPTLQVDDVGYHLRLPWQLLQQSRYVADPETHIWALAPWLGDVLQAVPQLLSGSEARGPLNALWMLLTACGAWHLAQAWEGNARAGWAAIALYASLPLTATLAGSMQTEAPTAALLVWLTVLVARKPESSTRILYGGAVLVGGLLGLKLAAAVAALLMLPWALWRHRPAPGMKRLLGAVCVVVLLGSSSFVYATILTGNPFLPLFNGWFHSPYFPASNFDDTRWHAGFGPLLPWQMTFDTGRYVEAFAGGGGFIPIILLGAWFLAFTRRSTMLAAAVLSLCIAIPLIPMQYLRYVFPASVALLPLLAVTALHFDPRRGAWLLAAACLLNFAFQANGHWMLRTGAVKQTVLALGKDEPLFLEYAPERILLRQLRAEADPPRGNVLALDPNHATTAEMGSHGRTTSLYDPSMAEAGRVADADSSGAAWQALLQREGISDVVLRSKGMSAAQSAGLQRAGAIKRGEVGDAQWWALPRQGDTQ